MPDVSRTPADYSRLRDLSAKATPGPWKAADPVRVKFAGMEGPLMSYLYGDQRSKEGMKVSLGSERVADHHFVAELVNAFRSGALVMASETPSRDAEDAQRYLWFRDECDASRRIEIVELATDGLLLDHHIDKGRCGL